MNHEYIEILPNSDYAKKHRLNTHDYQFFKCELCGLYRAKYKFKNVIADDYNSYSAGYDVDEDIDEDIEPSCNEFLMRQILK